MVNSKITPKCYEKGVIKKFVSGISFKTCGSKLIAHANKPQNMFHMPQVNVAELYKTKKYTT